MKKKLSRDEKRRVRLGRSGAHAKQQAGRNDRSGRVMFAGRGASSRFVRANASGVARGDGASKTPLNKRLMALVLAIVMVLALVPAGVFVLKGRAGSVNKAMEPVVMAVRVNGQETGQTAVVQAGEITPASINLGDYELPEGVAYVKSVVYDSTTNGETQIYAVGQKANVDYYSIKQDAYSGVAKNSNDRLILDFANKYDLHFNGTENNGVFTVPDDGMYTTNAYKDLSDGSWYIYGGEDLIIKEITPAQDRTVSRVTYTSASSSGTERIRNSQATIASGSLTGETTVNVTFNSISEYTVQDARYMSGSKYYSQYSGLDNHGGTSQYLNSKSGNNKLKAVKPGDDAEFYLFSQNNTTNQHEWRLSMLSINGVDLKFPADGAAAGTTVSTPFGNETISVEYISEKEDFGTDGDIRTAYKITVPKVHENLEVNYYFTDIKDRYLIVKGLTGIAKTAASVENYVLTGDIVGKWYTYTTSKQNVYKAFYDPRTNYPSDNLVLYTVKPGYNPYAITASMFDGQTGNSIDIRATSTTGSPQDVIKVAGNQSGSGNFDTDWRHWGRNTVGLKNNDDTYGFPRRVELLLTTIDKDVNNTWYAVALAQSTAMNQQLYLNAPMYPYVFAYDLDSSDVQLDGTFATDGDYLVDENHPHYIDGDNTYGFLPTKAPTRRGYEFVGWVMLDAEGRMLDELHYTFQPSDRIDIDTETIGYAYGDKTSANNSVNQQIRFKARWNKLKNADTTVTISSKVQTGVENGVKQYRTVLDGETELQIAGDTALLNDATGLAGNKHYVVNEESSVVKTTNEAGTNNDFIAIYDFNLLDVTVKNTVLGFPKTQRFEITVTFAEEADNASPVDLALAQQLMTATLNDAEQTTFTPVADAAAGTLTYTLFMTREQQVVFENVPYGWTYTVSEEEKANDYTREISSENGTVKEDMTVEVTNMSDSSELHTTKTISFNESTGKYDLKLEAWATGDKISKYDKDPIPTDIALVIDQSGSMATTDMNPKWTEAENGKKSWTVSEATSGEQLYVKVNGKMYPVHAGEGTLYENVGKPKVYSLVGSGHNSFTVGVNGCPTYYNIKTNYYHPDQNGVMRRVYTTSTGGFTNFRCFQYYFNSDANETAFATDSEKRGTIYYVVVFDSWDSYQLKDISDFKTWIENNAINFIGYRSGSYEQGGTIRRATQNDGAAIQANWNWFGANDAVKADLYQIKDGTNYNHLYYVNDQGNPISLTNSSGKDFVNLESQEAYNGVLYKATGESRLYVLQDAVKEFVEMVADNAATNHVDHRISMIGFAGSKTPGISTAGGIWHATPNSYSNYYDYVNTGLFLQGNFQNYQTITDFIVPSDYYINWHYYANNSSYPYNQIPYGSNKLAPVLHNGSAWQFLGTATTTTGTKYLPTYTGLTDSNYINSLVSVSPTTNSDVIDADSLIKDTSAKSFTVNSGTENGINDYLDTAITQFGSYGGTYTSYGMAMANRVLTLAKEDDPSRQRVIVVFTDGEPGKNGYDAAIANEALFDSNDSKSETSIDAKVYTVGLYTGNVRNQVETFMKKLSSEYSSASTTKVYSGSKDGVNSSLDNTKTYYFKDPTEKKTYSLTAVRNGVPTLGWWSKTSDGSSGYAYKQYNPMTSSDETKTSSTSSKFRQTYNSTTDAYLFYKSASSNNPVFVNDSSYDAIDPSQTYYVYVNNSYVPVNYENRWYDSNNRIRDPMRSESDIEGRENRYQFYEMGDSTFDGEAPQYYYPASDADSLKDAFQQISDSMVKSKVSLNGSNSILRDVVTGNFANVIDRDVEVYTVDGTYNEDSTASDKIDWATTGEGAHRTFAGGKNVEENPENSEESLIEVTGFDYSTKFVEKNHPGEKLVVEIKNLDPEALGYDLESNTNASGIIETGKRDGEDYEEMLVPFEIPSINRYQHNLSVEGIDTSTNYGMKLLLTPKEAGGTVPSSLTVYYRSTNDEDEAENMGHEYSTNAHTLTFTNGVAAWPMDTNAVNFSSLILEDLDDQYEISMKVDEPSASSVYEYSLALDNKSKQFDTNNLLDREKTQTTKIESERALVPVSLRELTQMNAGSTADYTDPEKEFTIKLTLTKDGNGTELGEAMTFSGITFDKHGNATIPMKHEQTRTLELPNGYYLAIDVDEDTQDQYSDTYTRGTNATDGKDVTEGSGNNTHYAAYAIAGGQYITIINSMEEPVITGFYDNERSFGIVLGCIAAVSATAAAGYVVMKRRRART